MAAKRKIDLEAAVPRSALKKSRKAQPAPKSTPTASTTPKPAASQEVAVPSKQATFADDKVQDEAPEKITNGSSDAPTTTTVQIITGSYERVLHGFTAAIPHSLIPSHDKPDSDTTQDASSTTPNLPFADTFLFNAHTAAIRCLALSPLSSDSTKVTLATGSTDERINIYSLSTIPPRPNKGPQLPTLHTTPIASNPKNRELGSLLHHTSTISALHFPTRAKLMSASEDNTIAITRTRDWTPLSTIKAPIPKAQGRPSGDTAAPGEVPCGINAFAVHPSLKLMVSVSRGERCMRLWNLITGKKAGVLNFGRGILEAVGEGRFGSGEGRKVVWDAEGDEFCVGFERGVVLFGMDSKPKGKLVPTPRTKIQEVRYLPGEQKKIVAVSTEDGRVLFYDTETFIPATGDATAVATTKPNKHDAESIPACPLLAQLGGPAAAITSRIKDFEILSLPSTTESDSPSTSFVVVTASSDGNIRLWTLSASDLVQSKASKVEETAVAEGAEPQQSFTTAKQVGSLIGTYATGNRITCLKAFVMTGEPEDEESEDEQQNGDEKSSSESESESDDE